jgi:hypothetical protein
VASLLPPGIAVKLEIRMPSINWDEWTLSQLIPRWANELGTTESDLWTDVVQAFNDGLFDQGGALTPRYVLIDKGSGPVLPRKDPRRWGDRIVLCKEAMNDLARNCNRSPPSWCSDVTKDPSQPSRPSQLAPASDAMINEEMRSEYRRANAAVEKPPNVKEVTPPVQLALEQKGRWASKRRIEKLAEAEEFKCLRWPPGKRRSKPGKK